jgi:hypothetical protein
MAILNKIIGIGKIVNLKYEKISTLFSETGGMNYICAALMRLRLCSES